MESLLSVAAIASAILWLCISVQMPIRLGGQVTAVLPALVFMTVWSLYSAASVRLDLLMTALWVGGFLVLLRSSGVIVLSRVYTWVLTSLSLLPLFAALFAPLLPTFLIVFPMLLSLVGLLMVVELVIRTLHGTIRALSIAMGTLGLFQIYFYAQGIAVSALPIELVGARVLLNLTIAVLLAASPFYIKNDHKYVRQVGLSRPMAFTTTSVFIAGTIITGIASFSYLLNTQVGAYRDMIEAFLLFLCVLLLGFSLGSSSQRARIRVWINKHFFQTKYDYNKEWKDLSDRLATADREDFEIVALGAVMALYRATSGVLFTVRNNRMVPSAFMQMTKEVSAFDETEYSEFLQKAAEGWIYVKGASNSLTVESFSLVPEQIDVLSDAMIVVPLVRHSELIGLIAFSPDRMLLQDFDYEDLDLLKTVAKQLAHFVSFHLLSEERAVKQQFEAYHQFTTFVMHDLKNLIAQQELVVQNADRFKDNPEFIADAFTTIDSSVQRMKRLMSKINKHSVVEHDSAGAEIISIREVVNAAIDRVNHRTPVPVVIADGGDFAVRAERESLTMALTHLLSNAQEACSDGDGVSIEVDPSENGKWVYIDIADTGIGMEPQFVENRLFRPFDSTKKTVGMGIGAYQSREIVSRIGGHISVDSTPGVGSCFRITLPLVPS